MRSLNFSTHPRLRFLITITRRDDTVIRLTTNQQSVTLGSETWAPYDGLKIGDFTDRNDGTIPSTTLSLKTATGATFDPIDIGSRLFENALVEFYLVDISQASSPDPRHFWFIGRINADLRYGLDRVVTFDITNIYAIPRDVFIRTYQLMCDANFGDPRRCKIPTFPNFDATTRDLNDVSRLEVIAVGDRRRFRFASAGNPSDYHNVYLIATVAGTTGSGAPTISDTPEATSTDGTVTWTTKNAYARYAKIGTLVDVYNFKIDALPDSRSSVDTWFNPGRIVFRSGYLNGLSIKVWNWRASDFQVTTFAPVGNLMSVNDWIEIAPDCDKTLTMCVNKYSNANNYRGFPYLQGDKANIAPVIDGSWEGPGVAPDTVVDSGTVSAALAVEFAAGID